MLNLRNQTIYVALKPVDMRKSFDGLADIVQNHFTQNPLNGEYFVFINRSADRIKIFYWYTDGGGRKGFPNNIPRQTVCVDLPDDEKSCSFG